MDLPGREEVRNLERGRLRRVRPVHGVRLDRAREVPPDGAGRRLGGVGRPHQLAQARDGILALQHHGHARPLRHERAEARIEGSLLVDGVESGGLSGGEVDAPGGQDPEPRLLEAGDDPADDALLNGVGLDDGERALHGHGISLPGYRARPSTRATVAPMSAGLRTVVIPDASMARIFSAAVPFPPEMMAPAWPIRRPGGAVCPQMKPTTGFLKFFSIQAAASSSAVPPISPIIATASVSGSAAKSDSASMKLVPISGS